MKTLKYILKNRLLILDVADTTYEYFSWNLKHIKLICEGSKPNEDLLKDIVEFHPNGYYKDYNNENNFFTLPSKSAISAVEAEGFYWLENPIKKPNEKYTLDKINVGFDIDACEEWQEAEAKTFKNPLLFEIF